MTVRFVDLHYSPPQSDLMALFDEANEGSPACETADLAAIAAYLLREQLDTRLHRSGTRRRRNVRVNPYRRRTHLAQDSFA